MPQQKLHVLKIFSEKKAALNVVFDEVKNNLTYSIIIAKHAHGKV